jgi:dihydrofolate synthase/folylpolyglutamate synthase
MTKEKASYQAGIEYLYSLQKYGIKFGLSKTSNLMKAFGNPHEGRKYIHIAGTNGKGSVAAFVASILKQCGFKVGQYSSPHLVRFTERFKINDGEISREEAADLINELKGAVVPASPPTFFEATTAMAFLYFARENTDIDIMEVGMGGRLDATNLIWPLVSVITSISMEHQSFLGYRLLDIAGEKGGIIKEGIDLVTGVTQPSVFGLFKKICHEKRSPIWRLGKDFRYRSTRNGFHYRGFRRRFNRLELGLKGKFQARNAALALAVIELLEKKGFSISPENIQDGLKNLTWPGRLQIVGRHPTIVVDGAHNPAAIRALAESIRTGFDYKRMILVIGIMEDKEIGQMLRAIVPMADHVFYTRPVYSRAADPATLMVEASALKRPGEVEPALTNAIKRAVDMAHPDDLVVVCGSLFTVGEALTFFDPETYAPDNL